MGQRFVLRRAVAYVVIAFVFTTIIGSVMEASVGVGLALGLAIGVGVALGILGFEVVERWRGS